MKKLSATNARKIFRYQSVLLIFLAAFFVSKAHNCVKDFDSSAIIGRWDITIHMGGKELPSWLEVQRSGFRGLIGLFVGTGGSARPISKVNFTGGRISFSIPPQWEQGSGELSFDASLNGENLNGTIIFPDGKIYECTAVRAPALKRQTQPQWGTSMRLFDGNDLKGWHATGENQWKAENGILRSPKSGSNIVTDGSFTDFKLHIEFRYPKKSNSGVYLRGRYEVQIEDDEGTEPVRNVFSAVYGFISPNEMVAKKAGEWQSYDVTLVGRLVTVVANGKTVICSQEIPGITGGALNSNEGEPGPIYLQGDHGPIEYRNIILTPAK
ncbi:MAG: DUF1080 domain-containing protein [Bacteroidetes bacterium]|nr:MAG: DUF1080 domain-containing protein [Bacteroidota bacterium]